MSDFNIPIVAGGKVFSDYTEEHPGRFGESFRTPDPNKYFDNLVPKSRFEMMRPLYRLSVDEIVEYLVELGKHLDIETNPHLQWAWEIGKTFTDQADEINRMMYKRLQDHFSPEFIDDMISTIGREYLEGWADYTLYEGKRCSVRPVGVPTVHIIAGNGHIVGAITLLRNALIRSHAIVKIPSNELGTPVALARTMVDMAPDHPLTKAFNVAYWKGGDVDFERKLYHPGRIDRIVAWGGDASIKHLSLIHI